MFHKTIHYLNNYKSNVINNYNRFRNYYSNNKNSGNICRKKYLTKKDLFIFTIHNLIFSSFGFYFGIEDAIKSTKNITNEKTGIFVIDIFSKYKYITIPFFNFTCQFYLTTFFGKILASLTIIFGKIPVYSSLFLITYISNKK